MNLPRQNLYQYRSAQLQRTVCSYRNCQFGTNTEIVSKANVLVYLFVECVFDPFDPVPVWISKVQVQCSSGGSRGRRYPQNLRK